MLLVRGYKFIENGKTIVNVAQLRVLYFIFIKYNIPILGCPVSTLKWKAFYGYDFYNFT